MTHEPRWIGDTVGTRPRPVCPWNCYINHAHKFDAETLSRRFETLCSCGHDRDDHRSGTGYCHRCSGDGGAGDCRSFARER